VPGREQLALEDLKIHSATDTAGQLWLAGLRRRMPRLSDLDLGINIEPAGAAELAAALPTLTALTSDHSNNTPDCATANRSPLQLFSAANAPP